MGVLGCAAAALVTLAGCYAPSLRDCTVSCASQRDCAGGQVCGSDGMCASPELAGRCVSAPPDAALIDADMIDAPLIDAALTDAALTDAPAPVLLRVQVLGKGSIAVDGHGICSSLDPQKGVCAYEIAARVPQIVRALSIQPDQVFANWTSLTCSGEPAVCTVTPIATTTIVARFVKAGAGG